MFGLCTCVIFIPDFGLLKKSNINIEKSFDSLCFFYSKLHSSSVDRRQGKAAVTIYIFGTIRRPVVLVGGGGQRDSASNINTEHKTTLNS